MDRDLKDLVKLKNKYDEEHDKYLRSLADIENMRKNFAKKQADLSEYKHEDLMTDFLVVLDDIDRMTNSGDLDSIKGACFTIAGVYKVLSKYGLEPFYPEKDDDFDADTMEAVSVIDAGKDMINKVIECTLKGYKYKDKIIRYPRVIVGK